MSEQTSTPRNATPQVPPKHTNADTRVEEQLAITRELVKQTKGSDLPEEKKQSAIQQHAAEFFAATATRLSEIDYKNLGAGAAMVRASTHPKIRGGLPLNLDVALSGFEAILAAVQAPADTKEGALGRAINKKLQARQPQPPTESYQAKVERVLKENPGLRLHAATAYLTGQPYRRAAPRNDITTSFLIRRSDQNR